MLNGNSKIPRPFIEGGPGATVSLGRKTCSIVWSEQQGSLAKLVFHSGGNLLPSDKSTVNTIKPVGSKATDGIWVPAHMYDLSRNKSQNKKPFVIRTELTFRDTFPYSVFQSFFIMVEFYAPQTQKFVRFIKGIHPFVTYSASVSHRYSQQHINL